MTSRESLNCAKLCDAFEAREAIYIEQGVLRVRVTDIRCTVGGRSIRATVEEIPTAGLAGGRHCRPQPDEPLRWKIGAGSLTTFSGHTWHMGYGGWSLFFAPEVVNGLTAVAAVWPVEIDGIERYNRALRFLHDHSAYEQSERVFDE